MRYSLVLVCVLIIGTLKSQPVKVACIGDSITEGHGIEKGQTYPDHLGRLLGEGYEVRNYGVSGRTLLKKGDFPYWHEAKYQEALAWQPDIVVIKLGTNDSKPQNWQYKAEFIDDYIELVGTFSSLPSAPKIYLCLPVPVFEDNFDITERIVGSNVVPCVEIVVKETKAKKINLYKALSGHAELFPDGVHPNAEGARLMAKAIYKKIK